MAGSSFTLTLIASETPLDGSGGGGSVQISSTVNVAEVRSGEIALTDAVTPVSLPVPAAGAKIVVLKVHSSTTSPTVLLTSASGATQAVPFDVGQLEWSSLTGPTYTAIALKGVAVVQYLIGG